MRSLVSHGCKSMNGQIYESGEYLDKNPDWHAADAPYKTGWISEILRENGVYPETIVEIGCGSGEILVNLAKVFPHAKMAGYDISPQAHEIASPKTTENISFHKANYLEEPVVPTDVVMAIDVFEHVEDYMGFIRAMKGRAKWTVFHIPLDLSVQGLLRGKHTMRARRDVGHLHYFEKESALATVSDCGFEIGAWKYTYSTEKLPGMPAQTRLFNLVRKGMRLFGNDFGVRVTGGASMMVLAR